MSEAAFSRKVLKRLRSIPHTFVVRTEAGSIRGIPDLLICHKGKFFAWELKLNDTKPTYLQTYCIQSICDAGGKALVVRPNNFEESINQMIGEKDAS